jgi:hypothetical protein
MIFWFVTREILQMFIVVFELLSLFLLRGGIVQGVPDTATIADLLCVPIWVLIIPDSFTRALWQLQAQTLGTEAGETSQKIAVNFAYEVSLSF